MDVIFALAKAYFIRGSARESEFFIQQASAFAESLNAPAMSSRALTRLGELQINFGNLEESLQSLEKAANLIQEVCPQLACD